ncbi:MULTISPECIES: hypothetical protein [unclassified Kitasatospora]|uniref:hypothetical protein n=1 Tax=unclassified Kitasatospora TaxID=2633591 RepID=UPI0033DD4FB2
MSTYDDAVIVTCGELTFPAQADLSSASGDDPLTSWGGTLIADNEEHAFELRQARQGLIQFPDGREGLFKVTDTETGELWLGVQGYGPTPF